MEARLSGGPGGEQPGTVGPGAEATAPMEGEEAALLAATLPRGDGSPSVIAPADSGPPDDLSAVPTPPISVAAGSSPPALPELDELVARIPGPVREALDELFRARFTTVRRYPAQPAEA